jgi:CBS domain containing-hemolysin-like protein
MIVVAIILALLLSAFFSGSEIAFISASKLGVELKRSSGSRRGAILASFYDNPDRFLGIMLVGNNIALVIFTYLMTRLLTPFFEPSIHNEALILLINTIIITGVVLLLGEFLPKTMFRLYANSLLYALAIPLLFFKYLLGIPAWVVTKMSNWFLKNVMRVNLPRRQKVFTRTDLESFVSTRAIDSEDELEADMFKNALHLQKVKVRECMVPRTEVQYIDVTESRERLIELFQSTAHSRIIVVENDIDHVIGYVHHLQFLKEPGNLKKIVLAIPFVPESMNVKDLLVRFIRDNTTIACVVDEYGGTSGLITMEDVLEEIFGEIEDEHDQEEYVEAQIMRDEYIFSGRLEIDYLNEKYDLDIPEGEYSTLSGYLVMTTQSIPEEGDEIELEGYRYILDAVSEKKIETVRVIKLTEEEQDK